MSFLSFISNNFFLQTSGSSNPSTPGVSRSSTPAPPDHDDEGSDEDEENQPPPSSSQISSEIVIY